MHAHCLKEQAVPSPAYLSHPSACPESARHPVLLKSPKQHSSLYFRPSIPSKRCKSSHHALAAASAPATSTLHKPDPQPDKATALPADLRKYVARVTVNSQAAPVEVYILGLSHVSRQSCRHTAELITAVKPDLVQLELCKDRLGLLIEASLTPTQHWHSRSVTLDASITQQPRSVQQACSSLLTKLQCQPGRPFSAYQIEEDCMQLLSSGLFQSVMPVTQPASSAAAPMFMSHAGQVIVLRHADLTRFDH